MHDEDEARARVESQESPEPRRIAGERAAEREVARERAKALKSALQDAPNEKRVFRALVMARCRATGPLRFEPFDSRRARYNFRALHNFSGAYRPGRA